MGFVGLLVLFGTVFGGFFMSGGASSMGVFLHAGEYVTIMGASLATIIISMPTKYLKDVFAYGIKALTMKDVGKNEMLEGLGVMYELFQAQKKEGVQAIEGHIENPEGSALFKKYPGFLHNHHAVEFLADSMRTFISGGPTPYDMDDLLQGDMDAMHEEEHKVPSAIQSVADGFPAIGIVAAVLGVINTMGSIAQGPEVVGEKVAAALVGTFLGIFVGYGMVGPIATRLNHHYAAEGRFFAMLKAGIVANCRGLPPGVSVEFARRTIYVTDRPTFKELEEILKNAAAAGIKKAA
jgi:chemotaxis protein MotA